MVASKEYREWHLTPLGWVQGTNVFDLNGREHVDPPENRVLTLECGEVMRSTFSGIEPYKREIWRAEGQDGLIAELLEKYGDQEEGY